MEGKEEDFVAGVTSNDEKYPDVFYISADLEFVDKMSKGKKTYVETYWRGIGEHL